jgi:DNA replication protein DnaC
MSEGLTISELQDRPRATARIGAASTCPLCRGTFIVPKIQKARLLAEACACRPIRVELPSLSRELEKRFQIWQVIREGKSPSRLYPSEPKKPFSEEEYISLRKIRSQLENGQTLEELVSDPRGRTHYKKAFEALSRYETALNSYQAEMDALKLKEGEEEIFSQFLSNVKELEKHNEKISQHELRLGKIITSVWNASLFTSVLPNNPEALPRVVQGWLKSLTTDKPESLFIYGPNGTGKTTLAVEAAFYAIILSGMEAAFFTSDEVVGSRKDAITAQFNSPDASYTRSRWGTFKQCFQNAGLVIIDDLGSQKATDSTQDGYSEVIGIRYNKHLPTIYTSNHWLDGGLDGKSLKDKIGARAADRVLGSKSLFMGGESKRASKEDSFDYEQVDQEVVKNFQTKGICEGETTSPFFIAHNPIFQLVSNNERAEKTDVEGRDLALPERRYRDTWHKGDDLTMIGYLLCQNDMMTLLALLEILHDFHRTGGRGISFDTTISAVRKKLNIKDDSSASTKRFVRSIDRLAMTKIRYIGSNKEKFIGGFIDTVYHKSATSQSKLTISLNPAFISFYEKLSFFKLTAKIPIKLSYQAKLLYVFLESHSEDELSFPLPQLAKLYGKDESAPKNRKFREDVRSSFKELKEAGLQLDEANLDRNGIVSTKRIPRTSSHISLPSI